MAPLCAGSSTPLKSQSCASNLATLHAKNWRQPRTPVSDCVRLACWGSLGHTKKYKNQPLWTFDGASVESENMTLNYHEIAFIPFPNSVLRKQRIQWTQHQVFTTCTRCSPPLLSSPRSRDSIWPITSNRKYRSWLAKSWRDACREARSWKGTSANLGNSLFHMSKGFNDSGSTELKNHSLEWISLTKHRSNERTAQKTLLACSCWKTLSTASLKISRFDFRGRGVDLWTWLKWQKGHLGRRHLAVLAKNTQGLHVPPACCWIFTLSSVSGSQSCCICCSFLTESVDKTKVASAINLCPQLRARRGCWPTSCHDQHSSDQSHSLQSELLCKISTAP